MQGLSIKICLLWLSAIHITVGQDSWISEQEGLPYGEQSTVSYVIQNENGLVPAQWIPELNTGINFGFRNAGIFKKIHKMEIKGVSYLSGTTAAHYMARVDFQLVKINGESPEEWLPHDKSEVFMLAFLKVYDVVNGTMELAKEITYTDNIEPYDDSEKIAGYFRAEITKALRERFSKITTIYKANIVEEKGDKLKTIFIKTVDHSRMLKPDILFAFVSDQEINGIKTFKQIGAFKKTDTSESRSRVHLIAKRGKKEILAALNNQIPIYLTRKAL